MKKDGEDPRTQVIGYSAFDMAEECYEYNEDACYIADDEEAILRFLDNAQLGRRGYRPEPVTVSAMVADYGCSCGEYALEPKAMERFERIAEILGIRFTAEPFEYVEELSVVKLETVDREY